MRHCSTSVIRALLVLLVAAGVVSAWLMRGGIDPLAVEAAVRASPAAPLVFVLVTAAAGLVFLPRTVFAAAGGLLFGLWWGLLWATVGSMAGSLAAFLLARYVGAGIVDQTRWPRLAPVLRAAERGGWRTIALVRLVPVLPNAPVNFVFGLTRVSLGSYALGSFLGMLPMTFVCAELGAGGNSALSGRSWIGPTLIGLGLLTASLILRRLPVLRRSVRLGVE